LRKSYGKILALSKSAGTSHSESACGSDPVELVDANCVKQARSEEQYWILNWRNKGQLVIGKHGELLRAWLSFFFL